MAGSGALSAVKAGVERPFASAVFLDPCAGKAGWLSSESGCDDLLWKRSHACALLPGYGGGHGKWETSCSRAFQSPGSCGDLLYRALAGLCSILCSLPVMCGDGTLAGASGQVSSGGKGFYEA